MLKTYKILIIIDNRISTVGIYFKNEFCPPAGNQYGNLVNKGQIVGRVEKRFDDNLIGVGQ